MGGKERGEFSPPCMTECNFCRLVELLWVVTSTGGMGADEQWLPGGRNGKASVPGASSFKRTLSRPGICWEVCTARRFSDPLGFTQDSEKPPMCVLEKKRKEKKKEIFYPHAADSEEEFFFGRKLCRTISLDSPRSLCCAGHHKLRWPQSRPCLVAPVNFLKYNLCTFEVLNID